MKRLSNHIKAMKMRARGYKNSGRKTPNGLTIWTKTVNGVRKNKTANGTPVNNGSTSSPPPEPNMWVNTSNYRGPPAPVNYGRYYVGG